MAHQPKKQQKPFWKSGEYYMIALFATGVAFASGGFAIAPLLGFFVAWMMYVPD